VDPNAVEQLVGGCFTQDRWRTFIVALRESIPAPARARA
jgi:hypothetical protein